jgi:hypothetical protein
MMFFSIRLQVAIFMEVQKRKTIISPIAKEHKSLWWFLSRFVTWNKWYSIRVISENCNYWRVFKKIYKTHLRCQQFDLRLLLCTTIWGYGVQHHFQQYISYIVEVSFIGGLSGENGRPVTSHWQDFVCYKYTLPIKQRWSLYPNALLFSSSTLNS